jgi:hypothetical protein
MVAGTVAVEEERRAEPQKLGLHFRTTTTAWFAQC